MDLDSLRLLIAQKLAEGRLPLFIPSRVEGAPASGESCDACDRTIAPPEFVMHAGGLRLHVDCLYLLDCERLAGTAPAVAGLPPA